MVVVAPARPLVLRHKGGEERENPVEPDMAFPFYRRGSVLPQLVDGLSRITPIIYNNECRRIRLPVAGRCMDEPSPQKQHDGRPLQ